MVPALGLLNKYASTFRKIINSKVLGGRGSLKKLLRLNKDEDWEFLTAAMDIIDDASAAIADVQRFGLGGPTKHDSLGEKYLRLYGLLGATYAQQQSILTIYRIMNVPDLHTAKKKFDELKIRKLRHQLSAHGTDYRNYETGTKEAYVPLRFDLGEKSVTAVRYASTMEHKSIDLVDAINAHVTLMIDVMDTIIQKAIKTIFRQHTRKQQEFEEELSDLRIEREGGLVIKMGGAPAKLVVTFVGSR